MQTETSRQAAGGEQEVAQAGGAGQQLVLHPDAPWPCMRGDHRSTGYRPLMGELREACGTGREVRHFRTGGSIFSTPIVGPDECIYVGSADHVFYAYDPLAAQMRWKFRTGEVIDCAACLDQDENVYVASCDGRIYKLDKAGQERWRFDLFGQRAHFTPSTIFWWEANVTIGPEGGLFAGNDDFCFHAIGAEGRLRWSYLTGLHIWTMPAFGDDGSVYFVSFDTCAYALDRRTGALRWKTPVDNFVASSPAVGADGTVYFGSFDGHLYALDGESGAIKSRRATGGPIYASPALAPDGNIYVGSSDGRLYAFGEEQAKPLWSYETGDALRCSASLGPDPEGRAPYLIYFGGGNGLIYALEPGGKRRWSYDTLSQAPTREYPNINASIALGNVGLATASANGDVIWIPYDRYLQTSREEGFVCTPDDGYPEAGRCWFLRSPGGALSAQPVSQDADAPTVIERYPTEPLGLQLMWREAGQTRLARLLSRELTIDATPGWEHRRALQADGTMLSVHPSGPAQTSVETLRLRAMCRSGQEEAAVEGHLRLVTHEAASQPDVTALYELPFTVVQMAIYNPTIVPSFDQIGIASLSIDVRIVEVQPETGRVAGWGVQSFGTTESGEHASQIATPRHFIFAFAGVYREGNLMLCAGPCDFELTAFPVRLSSLHFAGSLDQDGYPNLGANMSATTDIATVFGREAKTKESDTAPPGTRRQSVLQQSRWRVARRSLGQLGSFVRQWFPEGRGIASIPALLRSTRLAIPVVWGMLRRKMFAPWGLVDEAGHFHGVGTFKAKALDEAKRTPPSGVHASFSVETRPRRLVATLSWDAQESPRQALIPGIMLLDVETCHPLPLDLNRCTSLTHDALGRPSRVELLLPETTTPTKAVLLLNTHPLASFLLD